MGWRRLQVREQWDLALQNPQGPGDELATEMGGPYQLCRCSCRPLVFIVYSLIHKCRKLSLKTVKAPGRRNHHTPLPPQKKASLIFQFSSYLCVLCFFFFFSQEIHELILHFKKIKMLLTGLRFPLTTHLSFHPSPDIPQFGESPSRLFRWQWHAMCVPTAKGWDRATTLLQLLNPNNTENQKRFYNAIFGTTCPELFIGCL